MCARVRVYVPVAVWRAAAQAECRAWLALLLGCTEAHARQHTRLHTGYMPAPAFRWVGDEASVDVGTHNDPAVYHSMQQHMYGSVSKE